LQLTAKSRSINKNFHNLNFRNLKQTDKYIYFLPKRPFIGYWLDMEIYVRVLVRSNIARRQERNTNYAPKRVHIFPYLTNNPFITHALLSQKA